MQFKGNSRLLIEKKVNTLLTEFDNNLSNYAKQGSMSMKNNIRIVAAQKLSEMSMKMLEGIDRE